MIVKVPARFLNKAEGLSLECFAFSFRLSRERKREKCLLYSSKGLRASSCSLVRHNHFRRFKIRPGSEDDCHGKPKAKGSCLLVSCSDTPRRSRLPSIFLVEEYGWPTNSFLSGPHDLVCPQGWRLSIRSANHTPSDPRQAQRLGSGDP